ncbi:cilia- and flagella-associated protein 54 [Erinaceus europaeus]|uniref:Cilia- and flagella-associated protein 54 n=1 Tax=Erinaceus europaeus TaxID=9365 RepID=A0ABM3XRW8_ERIEU|nr:cilia- and flagella-associated protein 54 [Erinaceus europaeus]
MAAQGGPSTSPSNVSGGSASPPGLPPTPPPTSTAISKSPQESKASDPSPAPGAACPDDAPPRAVFYGPLDARNPLLATCERELRELLLCLRGEKGRAAAAQHDHEFRRRCATCLFNIWTKYAPRLPVDYYNEKLLKVGDSLCALKEYKLALLQCYGRYLQQFTTSFDEGKTDVNQFKTIFFPKGLGDQTAEHTFHALNGKNICKYNLVCENDVNMQNKGSVDQCLHILSFFRLIMQVALPQEHLCWIVFNGTIHIYTICRKLMVIGQSSKALEYLLWASICMESSVPLLSVRYLTWRATLYTAVCQCYYDCQAGIHGEAFARRALAKIDELRQLELMSSSQSEEGTRKHYREATLKMAMMIFKRGVFESRRKNKSTYRPKVRINVKETQVLPWPRTITERLLDEMFDSTASRFLAVLEALCDSNRRTLQTGPIASDEVEVRDVVSELFIAGRELLLLSNTAAGGGFNFPNTSFLQLTVNGSNIISMDAAVKFVKLAFTYEEWSLFESSAGKLLECLQKQDDPVSKKAEKDLALLVAVEPLINVKRNKGLIFPLENYKGQSAQSYVKKFAFPDACTKTSGFPEDAFHAAAVLYSCVCCSSQDVQPEEEIVVDMIALLWHKCKSAIQRVSLPRNDCVKLTQKISTNKWIYLLWQINELIWCCKVEVIDIMMMAEVAFRLSDILESLGNPKRKSKKSLDAILRKSVNESLGTQKANPEILPLLKKKPEEQLLLAYELLDKVITALNLNRMLITLPDGSAVYDYCTTKCTNMDRNTCRTTAANSFMIDLHLKLLQYQHRIATVILDKFPVLKTPTTSKNVSAKDQGKQKQFESVTGFTELTVMNKIRKNMVSKSAFLMQKAIFMFENDAACVSSVHGILQEAYSLVEKVETERNSFHSYQKYLESSKRKKSKIPPPPILMARTYCSVTLKPAPFCPDVKVAWYCILGCKAEGSFGKVRINNNHLPNSGEAIPADGKSVFEVKGLETNEKYVFAIAAYSSTGKLIGDAVGETTKPILVYPPLSTLTIRMYLTQIAYQVGNYELAKKVFAPVWDYFIESPLHNEQSIVSLSNIMTITPKRLHMDVLAESSPILIYLFLRNIFIMSDIKIKEENLFCDNIKGIEIFPSQQIARLIECERVLVALELSNYLSDSNYTLQAVTQCYGLLAPMIYHDTVLVPIIQILIKCIVVLQGIPHVVQSKKNMSTFESVQHMVACCVFYVTKILRSWKEYDLAIMVINYGKKLLDITPGCRSLFGVTDQDDLSDEVPKKPVKSKKTQQALSPDKISEQLALLETHLLRLTKQYVATELSGAEDPIFLYPVVLNWSVKAAVKEVMKFKQRPRFLEFFTQVMLKCLNDEKFQLVIEMTNPITDFLKRRNDSLLGIKRPKNKDNITFNKKSTKPLKKFKAVLMEFARPGEVVPKRSRKKETLREFLSKNPFISEMLERERNKRSDVRKIAFRFLVDTFNPIVLSRAKKRRFHQIFLEEIPWKAQMNLYLANAYFNLFLVKLWERLKSKYGVSHPAFSFRSCDPNMFSLYNSGTVLPTAKLTLENCKVMLDFLFTTRKKKANFPSDAEEFSIFFSSKMTDENSSKAQTIYDSDSQSTVSTKEKDRAGHLSFLEHFTRIFLCCRRAMVLAYRGGYWTLLQNCCRTLWNYTQELQIIQRQIADLYKVYPINQDVFLCTIVLPFYLGAESLIEMLIELQNVNAIKVVEEKGEFSVPSCYGNIKNDNGGSSLTFEHPLDDVNVVDLKWIHDFVLKSLELLYQVERWENLVSLAIMFNSVSHERYTEQVTPLLVFAQRQLLLRINKFKGPDITQQPCALYESRQKEKITCRNFIEKQLVINTSIKKVTETGNDTEALQKHIYSEYSLAKELTCVPLDVADSLGCFRETLEKSKYHNRSIRHSRKLLSLFLAQTQGDKGGINNSKFPTGKVDFCLGTEEMHMPTPPDLSQENFRVFSSVEKSKLPYSQLGLVISSYYKTIDVLQASNQRSLKVQALNELGSLLIFAEKKRAALKCWSQALDDIFRKQDVLHTWREFGAALTPTTHGYSFPVPKDYSEDFLSKVGIWGCLQGAVIAAKIAQFIKLSSVEKRINCCILSALLFQGLLRTTLPHPKADRCYAQYEITQLLPGIELFADRYRADICSVVASLYYTIRELHFAKQDLIILPLLALYQYFVSGICGNLVKNLEARLLKIEVLIDLGFFSEAFYEITQIFYGKNMPCPIPSGYRATGKMKLFQSFDSARPLSSKENIQALDELISKGMPVILTTVGYQHLMDKFSFVKAYFLISVAATINCVPENIPKAPSRGFSSEKSKLNFPYLKELYSRDDGSSFCYLLKLKDDFTLCTLKALLLLEAEDKLNSLMSEMDHETHKNLAQYSAGDLEIVVAAQLQLAAIALQRHQAAYSAAIVCSVLRLLQDSKLFKQKEAESDTETPTCTGTSGTESKDDEFLDPISLNAREHFNIHLWLRCCLALVTAFVAQIRGIGIMKENDITDFVSLINEACEEAKHSDDKELQAEFLMQTVIIGLQEKHLKADIIRTLQDIIQLLEGNEFISPRSSLTLVRSMLLLDDLTKAEKFRETPSAKSEKLNLLNQCHNILIEQMLALGETIEFPLSNTDYASPLQPLKNIYLPHVMLLAKTKMRIGHTLAKQVYYTSKKKDFSKWLPALHLFEVALKLCKVSATEEFEVEAEILFQKGKIERQVLMEDKSSNVKLESLFEAVQLSLKNDQNSGLIRDSYLEMAMLFLHTRKSKSKVQPPPLTAVTSTRRHSSIKEESMNYFEMYSSSAWIAIRAAAQVSEAILSINLLIGKKNTRTDKVSQEALPNIPEFAIMDLLSSYTDYLQDNYQAVFQAGCVHLFHSDDASDATDATKKPETKVDVTWILLLRYYIHLQRVNSLSKLLASLKPASGISLPDDMLFTSLFNSGMILRQKEMHFFLKKFLQLYSYSCIDEFPKELLQVLENVPFTEKSFCDSSGKVCHDSSSHSVLSLKLLGSPSSRVEVSSDKAIHALNKELCFQWYIPPLERPSKETEPMVLLLYAYNTKPVKILDVKSTAYKDICIGSFWVPLKRVISIHERLSNLAQIAEITLLPNPEITSNENINETVETDKNSIDQEMGDMIIHCCSEIKSLFLTDRDTTPLFEVPFDASLPSLLNLERLFDLANGCIIPGGSLFNWMVSIIP